MRKTGSGLRRGAALVAVAVAMMAVTGTSASAASGLPAILNGKSDSQALHLKVTLPTVAELEATLSKVLGQPVDLPNVDLPESVPMVIDQVISLNHAEVMRAVGGVDKASGFAAAATGNILPNKSVSTSCVESRSCGANNRKAEDIASLELPAGLGKVQVGAAESVTKSLTDTRNRTALAKVNLSLKDLLKTAGVSETLKTLTETINAEVLPVVNEALAEAEKTIYDLLEQNAPAVKKELDKVITLGTIKPLPRLDQVGLLDLTVLDARADVFPKTVNGVKGLQAIAKSKVADLDVLGGWATADAVGLSSVSYANGRKADAAANSDVQIAGLDLGGALGIHVEEQDIADFLKDPSSIIEAIEEDAPEGLEPVFDEVVASLKMLQTIAGISYKFLPETSSFDKNGNWAKSKAGTLALAIEPKIPTLEALADHTPGVGNIVPRLDKDDYVPVGIKVELELPNASTAVAMGNVKGICVGNCNPRTGVETPALAAILLIGASLIVRRFAMAK